jgi:hypothetical protein
MIIAQALFLEIFKRRPGDQTSPEMAVLQLVGGA